MRKHKQEITDRAILESILDKAEVCRLGLCEDGMPYVVPICFGYEDNCIYVHSAGEGRKIDIIKRNNNVCFEAEADVEVIAGEDACKWSMRYLSVIGFGKAFMVNDFDDKIRGLNAIMRHYSGLSEHIYNEAATKLATIIKIEIESMTGKK
ncbi:MAG: pyridoxamine 5'-phosphate oxidase family protein, partial [Desulfomonile tiedjei]|nr:pyridoxamine 5'-phosphate oxidase family protein [Desulfomonile tiedjei]